MDDCKDNQTEGRRKTPGKKWDAEQYSERTWGWGPETTECCPSSTVHDLCVFRLVWTGRWDPSEPLWACTCDVGAMRSELASCMLWGLNEKQPEEGLGRAHSPWLATLGPWGARLFCGVSGTNACVSPLNLPGRWGLHGWCWSTAGTVWNWVVSHGWGWQAQLRCPPALACLISICT